MNKILIKTTAFAAIAFALIAACNTASADTITGRLTTGIGGTVGDNNVNGVVIAAPSANPPAGIYTAAQSVTLTADGASSINYSTDGLTTPICNSSGTVYSGPIAVNSSMAIEARSCYPNNASSTVVSYLYGINTPSTNSNDTPAQGGSSSGGDGGGGSVSMFSKGDSNGDGHVNILDFVTLMADWSQTGTGNAADFNGDGKVDILDFVILMANWTN